MTDKNNLESFEISLKNALPLCPLNEDKNEYFIDYDSRDRINEYFLFECVDFSWLQIPGILYLVYSNVCANNNI